MVFHTTRGQERRKIPEAIKREMREREGTIRNEEREMAGQKGWKGRISPSHTLGFELEL